MRTRHSWIAAIALALLGASTAQAAFEDGVAAYDKGDYATAFGEFEQAAHNGDLRAQARIAGMYLYGAGIPKDYIKAFAWFDLAAAQGDTDAAKYREAAATQLNTAQMREAGKLAEDYYDKYVLPFKD